jgi:hypothetical protein
MTAPVTQQLGKALARKIGHTFMALWSIDVGSVHFTSHNLRCFAFHPKPAIICSK